MKVRIKLMVGKKGIETIFDDEDDELILQAYIKRLIISLKSLQGQKYVNKKVLAYIIAKEVKKK